MIYDESVGRTLRALLGPLLVVAIVACSSPFGGSPAGAKPSAGPTGQLATAGPSTPVAPPAAGGGFDPQHVADVLGPAVAIVIVNAGNSTSEGTAFAIAHQGSTTYMVTNNHVIASGTKIQVLFLDGRHFNATLKGTDAIGDIAVLAVADGSLPLASFGDSSKVRLGQQVVAIGSPLGTAGSVTEGIISALHRSITAGGAVSGPSESLPDVLQTDAAINPGNSGGPLADGAGNVIGVNTAADRSGTKIGFAIPSLLVKRLADDLIAGRKPTHPFLGIGFIEESEALASGIDVPGYGTLVQSTISGSTASKVGIKPGDIIQKVDGIALNNGQTLAGVLQLHEVGDHVKLTILRAGSTQELDVTLGARPLGT
jgi:putative serine protease PepD